MSTALPSDWPVALSVLLVAFGKHTTYPSLPFHDDATVASYCLHPPSLLFFFLSLLVFLSLGTGDHEPTQAAYRLSM